MKKYFIFFNYFGLIEIFKTKNKNKNNQIKLYAKKPKNNAPLSD